MFVKGSMPNPINLRF